MTAKAPGAYPAIDDGHRDAAFLRCEQEVRPQLSLREDHQVRVQLPQCPSDGPGEIERPVDDLAIVETLSSFFHAGVGRGRNHALPVWVPPPERRDHLLKQVNLADADAVEPTGE